MFGNKEITRCKEIFWDVVALKAPSLLYCKHPLLPLIEVDHSENGNLMSLFRCCILKETHWSLSYKTKIRDKEIMILSAFVLTNV